MTKLPTESLMIRLGNNNEVTGIREEKKGRARASKPSVHIIEIMDRVR